MRKNHIDNLRWLAVLMLFPYHIFMVYNTFGESFYIKGADIMLTSGFIVVTGRWFMPLLFTIAGMSSAFALQKRNSVEYIKERVSKLFIPLIFGVLLIVPPQTYFAERFHNDYVGSYFQQYILFFTKPTDLSGYRGGFTPAHLWFLLYLFIISLIALPIMSAYQKSDKKLPLHKIPFFSLLVLFILPALGSLVLDVAGKSLGEYFMYFILGYFILSNENVLEKTEKYKFVMLLISFLSAAVIILTWSEVIRGIPEIVYGVFFCFYAWVTILALFGLSRCYLNNQNKLTDYFNKSSFSIYIFHQTWIIAAAYYTFKITNNPYVQMSIILVGSVIATFATYEICKRIFVARSIFGIRK